ncbi:hypothetical protein KM043_010292 [Ampulex compressa]|nr:hypothetical protein KM043_010292 [Ampulex compressa]
MATAVIADIVESNAGVKDFTVDTSVNNNDLKIDKELEKCEDDKLNDQDTVENIILEPNNVENNVNTRTAIEGRDSVEGHVLNNEGNMPSKDYVKNVIETINPTDNDESGTKDLDLPDSNIVENTLSKRLLNIVDSDSEDESIFRPELKKEAIIRDKSKSPDFLTSSKRKKKSKSKNKRRVMASDSEDDDIMTDNKSKKQDTEIKVPKTYQTLIDSESEEEGMHITSVQDIENDMPSTENINLKSGRKKLGPKRASKEEAMKQIHSETQRLLREAEISLPYHIPKQRTLQEFLNRKKVSTALPKAPTMAAKLKMSSVIVSKVLEEKEKEAELFYKSSDSEDEVSQNNPSDIKRTSSSCVANQNSITTNIENICIEDTQKMTKNVQDFHNKKEIIQQGSLDLGVPRKLFSENFNDIEEASACHSPLVDYDEINMSDAEPMQKHKEYKQGLKDISFPRKLFDVNFDENNEAVNEERITENDEKKCEMEIVQDTVATLIDSLENENSVHHKEKGEIHTEMEIDSEGWTSKTVKDCSPTDKNINTDLQCNEKVEKKAQLEAIVISETPHIDNKEVAKLLQKSINVSHEINPVEDRNLNVNTDINEDVDNEICTSSSSKNDNNTQTKNYTSEKNSDISLEPEFGLPPPIIDGSNPLNIKKKLLSNLPNLQPKLRGSPGMVIDLTASVKPNSEGINKLIDRFLCKHSSGKKQVESSPEVTVVHVKETVDGPMAVKETLPYKLPATLTEDPNLIKPGAKLMRLKEDLKLKMALKRDEEWKQKELDAKEQEDDWYIDENEKFLDDDEPVDDEELSDSGESEPEENDICIKERKKNKCIFADDEAEVSENEDDVNGHEDEMDNENDDEEEDENDDEEEEEDEGEDVDSEEDVDHKNSNNTDSSKQKKLKRIIKPFEEDSNNTNNRESDGESNPMKKPFTRTKTDVDIFETDNGNHAWTSDNESDVPACQLQRGTDTSQMCKTPLVKSSMLNLISPITQLTALNTHLDSGKKSSTKKDKFLFGDESMTIDNIQSEKLPYNACNIDKKMGLQKKLFEDSQEPTTEEELIQLCSGKFTPTRNTDSGIVNSMGLPVESNVSESQLLEMCSGSFSSQSINMKELESQNSPEKDDTSQNVKLIMNENSVTKSESEAVATSTQKPLHWTDLRVVSSDEDDAPNTSRKVKKQKKKKVKKLVLSDDEDDVSATSEEEEEEEEEQLDFYNEDAEKYIDYDSEENEIVVVPKKDIKKVAAGFLEKEAELSESEWGSADEDEKDLDKLEFDAADMEDIDENKVRDQIGKIQMRQILDEDQRDVRMLKELLFEDGDLHVDGTGRERKFKWRNIDRLGNDNDNIRSFDSNDGWVDLPEDENDMEWRKARHEREKFLEKQVKAAEDELENDGGDSQIFKLGVQALKKIRINRTLKQDSPLDTVTHTEPIVPRTISDLLDSPKLGEKSTIIHSAMQKRSLLARGEASLARIAILAKQSEASLTTMNTRNFVFTHVSQSAKGNSAEDEESEEKKEADLSNKRKRKAAGGMTPRPAKKSKLVGPFAKKTF